MVEHSVYGRDCIKGRGYQSSVTEYDREDQDYLENRRRRLSSPDDEVMKWWGWWNCDGCDLLCGKSLSQT